MGCDAYSVLMCKQDATSRQKKQNEPLTLTYFGLNYISH